MTPQQPHAWPHTYWGAVPVREPLLNPQVLADGTEDRVWGEGLGRGLVHACCCGAAPHLL